MELRECYNILGLKEGCTLEDLKKAYRMRALATHPDRTGKDADFVRVNNANEKLKKHIESGGGASGFNNMSSSIIDALLKQMYREQLAREIRRRERAIKIRERVFMLRFWLFLSYAVLFLSTLFSGPDIRALVWSSSLIWTMLYFIADPMAEVLTPDVY